MSIVPRSPCSDLPSGPAPGPWLGAPVACNRRLRCRHGIRAPRWPPKPKDTLTKRPERPIVPGIERNRTVRRVTLPTFTLRERQVFHGARARVLYELIAWKFRNDTDLRFMNYGYFGGRSSVALAQDEAAERYSAALYEAVATQAPLAGCRVLDVGTGRGGGASFVQRHLGAAETVGCDLAHGAVAFCARVHAAVPGLSFRQGDAMALPFAAESFDVVLNVESAHCYPDRAAFFSEVFRVMRPGGQFLMADFTPPRMPPEAERAGIAQDLSLTGFAPPAVTDITAAILAGLDCDNDRRLREIDARFPLGTRRLARFRAGL